MIVGYASVSLVRCSACTPPHQDTMYVTFANGVGCAAEFNGEHAVVWTGPSVPPFGCTWRKQLSGTKVVLMDWNSAKSRWFAVISVSGVVGFQKFWGGPSDICAPAATYSSPHGTAGIIECQDSQAGDPCGDAACAANAGMTCVVALTAA